MKQLKVEQQITHSASQGANETAIIILQQELLGSKIKRHLDAQGVLEACVSEAFNLTNLVVHGQSDTRTVLVVVHIQSCLGGAILRRYEQLHLRALLNWPILGHQYCIQSRFVQTTILPPALMLERGQSKKIKEPKNHAHTSDLLPARVEMGQ